VLGEDRRVIPKPFFVLLLIVSTAQNAQAQTPSPGISKSELLEYTIFKPTATECDFKIEPGSGDRLSFRGRPFGYRTLQTNEPKFNFVRPEIFPKPFEMVNLTPKAQASKPVLATLGLRGKIVINTQNKTIVGVIAQEYQGLEPDGKEAWAYNPCGLTQIAQIRDLKPSCNCSEGQ
jgi:hypothetical protein